MATKNPIPADTTPKETPAVEPLCLEAMMGIPRSAVRYALFRCRTGNPDDSHRAILGFYEPRLSKYGLLIEDFSEVWDVSKSNPTDIVSGHVVHLYKEDLKSLFNPDGTLKEA